MSPSVRPGSDSKKWSKRLNLWEYFDKFWRTGRNRQDLANELAKYEFSLTEAKPRRKTLKKKNEMKIAVTLEPCEIF